MHSHTMTFIAQQEYNVEEAESLLTLNKSLFPFCLLPMCELYCGNASSVTVPYYRVTRFFFSVILYNIYPKGIRGVLY